MAEGASSGERDAYRHERLDGVPGGPILLALHGTDGDGASMLGDAGDLVPGATVLAPHGDVREGEDRRFFRRHGPGAYDMEDLERAAGALHGFLAAHAPGHALVLALGYSNGANALVAMLLRDPRPLARAVLMHPLIPFDLPDVDLSGLDVLVTAGRGDERCPEGATRRLVDALVARGASVREHWHDGGHEIAPSEWEAARAFLGEALTRG